MKLTCRQQKLVTENNLCSVRENLENLCSYYKEGFEKLHLGVLLRKLLYMGFAKNPRGALQSSILGCFPGKLP